MDINYVRAQFPSLLQDQIFMDNAAGSQVVKSCSESVKSYFDEYNVQPAMPYKISREASVRLEGGYNAAAKYINASVDEIVFGGSTTQLVRNTSAALLLQPGDNIVLSKIDHEAHLAGWVQNAKWKGVEIRWWVPTKNTTTNPKLEFDDLDKLNLIDERTRLVGFTHTSNVLGSITDVSSIVKGVKQKNSKTLVSVDAVAYAPHSPIDIQSFGVDFYFFSWYKVYGPHLAMAYIRKSAFDQLESLGHYFLPKTSAVNIIGLAGGSYELIQSISAVTEYLETLGWDWIFNQEYVLQAELLTFLAARSDVLLYGEPKSDRNLRVPVISFRVKGWKSADLVQKIYEQSKCTPTSDHFYAKRLCEEVLAIDAEDGVVRCSFLHYNTVEEVKTLVQTLQAILDRP